MPTSLNALPWPLTAIPTEPWDAVRKLKGGDWGATKNRKRSHRGTDWSRHHIERLKLSLRMPCVSAGTVVSITREDRGELGLMVEIRDDEGWYWTYCHMKSIDGDLKVGDRVELRQTFGVVGQSGTAASVDHLHLMLSKTKGAAAAGVTYDPVSHILARLEPTLNPAGDGNTTPVSENLMTDQQYEALNDRVDNVENILTDIKELVEISAARSPFRLIRNSQTNRVALVGELIWTEANNVDEEYRLGRQYGLRAPGEKNSATSDWFKKYPGDILDNAEFESLKKDTLERMAEFAGE
jgi:hypothetical protein